MEQIELVKVIILIEIHQYVLENLFTLFYTWKSFNKLTGHLAKEGA